MSSQKPVKSHLLKLIVGSLVLTMIMTVLAGLADRIGQFLFPQFGGIWIPTAVHFGIKAGLLFLTFGLIRKFHGKVKAFLPWLPPSAPEMSPTPTDPRVPAIQNLLTSLPQLTNLLKSQLDQTNRISGEFAISILSQISTVQHEASNLLATLTDVRSKAEVMTGHAQKLIESSNLKLTEMADYTSLREQEITDDSQAIQRIVNLMKDLTPLTGLIGSLSKQTRLLALNASIQAANDRSIGRGFVAVADEMRKLAVQIESTSQQVDGVMDQVSRTIQEKLLAVVSVQRIETEKNWLHTLTSSMLQMSVQFEAAVFGLDRLSKDSHETVQGIFTSVLKAQELAQFQDISRQQIELVQQGLDLCKQRMEGAANRLADPATADSLESIAPLDDVFRSLEARYSMHTQQAIHDQVLFSKSEETGTKSPIVELF